MQIISTHRLTFVVDHKEFTTKGKNTTEEAPDWITQDEYFAANERVGRITNLSKPAKSETLEGDAPAPKGKAKGKPAKSETLEGDAPAPKGKADKKDKVEEAPEDKTEGAEDSTELDF